MVSPGWHRITLWVHDATGKSVGSQAVPHWHVPAFFPVEAQQGEPVHCASEPPSTGVHEQELEPNCWHPYW
jgi:hypothetical protein